MIYDKVEGKYTKQFLSITVRKNIRKYRLINGYTLQKLADLAGFTHGYVRDLECLTLNKTPTLESLGSFANALNIDIRQLFDEVEINLIHEDQKDDYKLKT